MALAIAFGSMGTLGFSITYPLLPELADVFGVSRATIGLVQASASVPGVIFAAVVMGLLAASWRPVLKCLLDRGRRRPPISRPGPPRSG
jgi:MFS family permease